jgi:hypothetical protein
MVEVMSFLPCPNSTAAPVFPGLPSGNFVKDDKPRRTMRTADLTTGRIKPKASHTARMTPTVNNVETAFVAVLWEASILLKTGTGRGGG